MIRRCRCMMATQTSAYFPQGPVLASRCSLPHGHRASKQHLFIIQPLTSMRQPNRQVTFLAVIAELQRYAMRICNFNSAIKLT